MTVVPATRSTLHAPQIPAPDERTCGVDMLDELIASHRGALLELAPHQEERPQRVEAGWHIAQLGALLCVRDLSGDRKEE